MDRRTFLELMGVGGAAATISCDGAPVQRLYAYLTPPQDIVPGTAVYYATVCRACPAGCGVIVKTREARPIKLEGNPAHPVNRGALCARGQAAIQGLYSRHRVRQPLVRDAQGKLAPASWDAALRPVAEKLGAARSIALLTGLESGSFGDLVADFRQQLPATSHVMHEPLAAGALRRASALLFGRDEVPFVDLSQSDHVLSLGADFLDTWLSPVAFARQWAEGHGFGPQGRRLAVTHFGPRRNLTANAADVFVPWPGHALGSLALGVLHAVHRDRSAQHPQLASLVARLGHADATPAESTNAARRLLAARRPLVLFGGVEGAGADATAASAAALLASYLLGAVNRSLRYGLGLALSRVDPAAEAMELIRRAGSGQLDALLVHGTNPAYSMPGGLEAAKQLRAARFVVALAAEHDETTAQAHVVLPVHHFLESWGDFEVADGIAGIMQPVRAPLFASRHVGDVLLELLRRAGKRPRFGDYKRYVAARWARRGAGDLRDVLVLGGRFDGSTRAGVAVQLRPPAELAAVPTLHSAAAAATAGDAALVVAASAALHDGRQASCDWLHETPDALSQLAWEIPVELAADVARKAGVRTGDRVRVTGPAGQLVAAALVDPDLAPGTAALRMGGGSARCRERLAAGNVMQLLAAEVDAPSGELAFAHTRVSVQRVGRGVVASVSGGTDSTGRHLCLGMELSAARAGRFPVLTRHGEQAAERGKQPHGAIPPGPLDDLKLEGTQPRDNIFPLTAHTRRWFMIVDLDRCSGCGACVVACHAENNIPVVGRAEVLKGREMAWLRVEKHELVEHGQRRVRFLPVMCQQCAQAPCEAVCPVFASYHTPEGLNGQIYNRCIGTRYCANNCPYKVRRFNYFDYPRDRPANQQLNPDVTVRSRGVMEKCTFCIQRIRAATNQAKAEGRALRDGEVQPACVQTCPTGALSFGDLKSAGWGIRARAQDPRGYRLLDYMVNTRPSVLYLRKVHSDDEGDKA